MKLTNAVGIAVVTATAESRAQQLAAAAAARPGNNEKLGMTLGMLMVSMTNDKQDAEQQRDQTSTSARMDQVRRLHADMTRQANRTVDEQAIKRAVLKRQRKANKLQGVGV